MLQALFVTLLVVSGGTLATGYLLVDGLLGAVFAPSICAAWAFAHWRGWAWANYAALILLFISAILSQVRSIIPIFDSVSPIWPVLSMTAATMTWAVANFRSDLKQGGDIPDRSVLESRLARRLLSVGAVAALLGTAAVQIQVQFGFGIALLLGALSILGLSRAVRYLRRESD